MSKHKRRWGVNWVQVGSGACLFFGGAAGALILFFLGGRIRLVPIAIAIVGIVVVIMGLLGEDGVW